MAVATTRWATSPTPVGYVFVVGDIATTSSGFVDTHPAPATVADALGRLARLPVRVTDGNGGGGGDGGGGDGGGAGHHRGCRSWGQWCQRCVPAHVTVAATATRPGAATLRFRALARLHHRRCTRWKVGGGRGRGVRRRWRNCFCAPSGQRRRGRAAGDCDMTAGGGDRSLVRAY